MKLNSLKPNPGSRKEGKRVGRGIGSGSGKTCGRGHKGLKARAGGRVTPGFEGGQMPVQRRLPKFGFNSAKARVTAEVRLGEIAGLQSDQVDLQVLKGANIVGKHIEDVKIILSGKIERAVTVTGLRATKGARAAIEAAGGTVQ